MWLYFLKSTVSAYLPNLLLKPSIDTIHYLYYSYNVCIRQEAGMCCVENRECDDTSSWTLDVYAMPISTAASTGI